MKDPEGTGRMLESGEEPAGAEDAAGDRTHRSRLSRITTDWPPIIGPTPSDPEEARRAREALIDVYYVAVHRYFLAATGRHDVADNLAQDVALKFIEGKLAGATPERGRFRDYLRRVLINMVHESYRGRGAWVSLPEPDAQADPVEGGLEAIWREELFSRAWDLVIGALQTFEEQDPEQSTVLEIVREDPNIEAPEIARRFLAEHGHMVEPNTARKWKERGFEKLRNHLIDEVIRSIETDDLELVREELRELDLLDYCSSTLERRLDRQRGSKGSSGAV